MRRTAASHPVSAILLVLPAALLLLPALTAATQPASSTNYFMPANEASSGGHGSSTSYRLEASFGSGVTALRATSTNFRLDGGFCAALDVPIAGRPWVTATRPLFGPILGGTLHTLHGTELHIGTTTTVTVGGQAAQVLSRRPEQVALRLPSRLAPGWQPVTVTNGGGTATLDQGLGVLPMGDRTGRIHPLRMLYRGTQGDTFIVAATRAINPFTIPIPPYHHSLTLDTRTLLGLWILYVANKDGTFVLDFSSFNFPRPFYVQMLGLTGNPGYAPGAFTNVIKF